MNKEHSAKEKRWIKFFLLKRRLTFAAWIGIPIIFFIAVNFKDHFGSIYITYGVIVAVITLIYGFSMCPRCGWMFFFDVITHPFKEECPRCDFRI